MPPLEITPLALAVQVIFACAIAYLARQRGRNPLGWFFGGILGGFLALVLLIVLPDLEKEKLRQTRAARPEPMPAPEPQNPEPTREPEGLMASATATSPTPEEGWFVAVPGGQARGPLKQAEARQLAESESLLVWHEDMQDWTPFPESLLARA